MPNRVEPVNDTSSTEKKLSKRNYFKLTFNELLTILAAAAVPVAIGVYTIVTSDQQVKAATLTAVEEQNIADARRQFDFKQAEELQQQHLFNNFIDNIFQLYLVGELNDTHHPWAFANARFRAVHRQLDVSRKVLVLKFLKEKQLIGRNECQTGCEEKLLEDIIRLNELNFDGIHMLSETGKLNQVDLKCVEFDHVSMVNATFTNADLSGTAFDGSHLNGATFSGSSFACAKFRGTELDEVDFGDSNLEGAEFSNVNLSTAKLTPEQLQQATFVNTTMPNGIVLGGTTTTSSKAPVQIKITNAMKTTSIEVKSSVVMQSSTQAEGTTSSPSKTTSFETASTQSKQSPSTYLSMIPTIVSVDKTSLSSTSGEIETTLGSTSDKKQVTLSPVSDEKQTTLGSTSGKIQTISDLSLADQTSKHVTSIGTTFIDLEKDTTTPGPKRDRALLLSDSNSAASNLDKAIASAGFNVTTSIISKYVGVPPASDFGVVVLVPANDVQDMPVNGQTSIVNAQSAGSTGIVMTQLPPMQMQVSPETRWKNLSKLSLLSKMNGAGMGNLRIILQKEQSAHPIWNNISQTFQTSISFAFVQLTAKKNTTVLAMSDTVFPSSVAVGISRNGGKGGRVVEMFHYGHGTMSGNPFNWKNEAQITKMMTNAIKWAAGLT